MAAAIEECKKVEKISDADYNKMKTDAQPRTKEMKCFGACFSEKTGQVKDEF